MGQGTVEVLASDYSSLFTTREGTDGSRVVTGIDAPELKKALETNTAILVRDLHFLIEPKGVVEHQVEVNGRTLDAVNVRPSPVRDILWHQDLEADQLTVLCSGGNSSGTTYIAPFHLARYAVGKEFDALIDVLREEHALRSVPLPRPTNELSKQRMYRAREKLWDLEFTRRRITKRYVTHALSTTRLALNSLGSPDYDQAYHKYMWDGFINYVFGEIIRKLPSFSTVIPNAAQRMGTHCFSHSLGPGDAIFFQDRLNMHARYGSSREAQPVYRMRLDSLLR